MDCYCCCRELCEFAVLVRMVVAALFVGDNILHTGRAAVLYAEIVFHMLHDSASRFTVS